MNGNENVSPTERLDRVSNAGREAVAAMAKAVLAIHDVSTSAALGNKWDTLDSISDGYRHLATAGAWLKTQEAEVMRLAMMTPAEGKAA